MSRVKKLVTLEVVMSVSIMMDLEDRRDVELCIDTVARKLKVDPRSVPKRLKHGMKARLIEGFTKVLDYDLKDVK